VPGTRPRILREERDNQGRLTMAEIHDKGHHYRLDVTHVNETIPSLRTDSALFKATCSFKADGREFLNLAAGIALPGQERVQVRARSERLVMSYDVDFSSYDELHLGIVDGAVNNVALHGFIDPRTRRTSLNLSLSYWLERPARNKLTPFVPLMNRELARYDAMRDPFLETIEETIGSSIWASLGRAGCWGFFTMLGGALGPPSIGLSATLFAVGASASVCSEFVEPLLKHFGKS